MKKRRSAFILEKLEPRVLLSADMALLPIDMPISEGHQSSVIEFKLPAQDIHNSTQENVSDVRHEVIFIDSDVEDYQQLQGDLLAQKSDDLKLDIVILEAQQDGVDQITSYLQSHQNISAVHIFSHGTAGETTLGNATLNLETLDGYSSQLESWQNSLTADADLLFYGCNLAADAEGQNLIQSLSLLTSADVAASDDLTGAAVLGGDWELEKAIGDINSDIIFTPKMQQQWTGVLDTPTTSGIPDVNVLENSGQVVVTLPDHFDDAEGVGLLEYSVENNTNSGLVSAVVGGASLNLNFAADSTGTSEITIRATDEDSEYIDSTFTVNVGDQDHLIANEDSYATNADTPLSVTVNGVLANDQLLEPFAITPGATLEYLAWEDTDSNNIWEDSTAVTDYDFDFTGATVVRDSALVNAPAGITAAYVFDGSGGGEFSEGMGALPGNPTNDAVSLEFWFRPSDAIGTEILFDTGSTASDGASLHLNGTTLEWTVWDTDAMLLDHSVYVTQDISTEIASGEFIQAVASFDPTTGTVSLRINGGGPTSDSNASVNDWATNSSDTGIGEIGGSQTKVPFSSNGSPFTGEIAAFRLYESVLDDAEVQNNYAAMQLQVVAHDAFSTGGGTVVVNPNGSFTYDPGSAFDYLAAGETAVDTFTYTIEDVDGNQSTATVSVTVTGMNDDPIIANTAAGQAVDDNASIAPFSSVTISDVDTPEQILTVTVSLDVADKGSFSTLNGFTDVSGGVYTFSGTAAAAQSAIRGLVFDPTENRVAPGNTETTTFTINVDDGATGTASDSATTVISTSVNDAPTATGTLTTTTLLDTDEEVKLFADITVTDPDPDADLILKIVLSDPTAGTLGGGGITETATGSGIYTRTGLTVAQANDALDSLQFTPTENTASSGSFTVDFSILVDDGIAAEQTVLPATTMTITRVNDAPTLSNALSINQGETVPVTNTMLLATDADHTAAELTFTVSNLTNGHFAFSTDTTTPITTFTQDDIDNLLVVFVHDGGELAPAYDVSVSDGSLSTSAVPANVTFTGTSEGVLWLSTDGSEGGGNEVPGLDSTGWDKGDILQMANPVFSLGEASTDGVFSIAFDISNFGTDANLNGLHYVTSDITIGITNAITLQAGDLLLSTSDDKTVGGLDVKKEDIFFFRPDSAGDYSAGSFQMLFTAPEGAEIRAVTLVEKDVWVGDIWLYEGDILFSRSGDDKDVWLLRTSGLDPSVVGPYTLDVDIFMLIDGSDAGVDIDHKIYGLDILEVDTVIGGQSYDAGTILISLDGDDGDGIGGSVEIKQEDIAAVAVTKTTLGSGAAQVDATLIFDGDSISGTDVNFDSGSEKLDGFTLTIDVLTTNTTPTLINNNIAVVEGQTTILTVAMLSATDAEDADSGLIFNVSSVDGGQFEFTGEPGTEIFSFNQGRIDAGEVVFVDDGDENAPTLDVNVFDGVNTTATVAGGVNFANVNDAPVLTTNEPLSVPEEATRTITSAHLSASDSDNTPTEIIYRLTSEPSGGNVRLSGSSLNSGDTFTQDDIDNNRVTYHDSDDGESTSFTFTLSDGTVTSGDFSFSVNGLPINDAPVVTAPGSALSATEQIDRNIHGTGFSVTDIDEAGFGGLATLTVGEGIITVTEGDSGVTVTSGNASDTVVLSGTITQLNALLTGTSSGTIVYLNGSDNPSASTVLTVTVNDQGNSGSDPGISGDATSEEGTNSVVINITAVNDAPVISAITDQTIDEDSSTGALAFTVGDIETAAGSLTVTASSSDTALIPGGNLSLVDLGSGDWTIEATPAANMNGGPVTITVTVNDGTTTTNETFTVTVNQVDDAATFAGDTSGSGNEDGGAITGTLTVTDTADGMSTPNFTISTAATHGTASIDSGTGDWSYTPNANFNGSNSFTVQVTDDDGNTATQLIFISVTAVNDPGSFGGVLGATIDEDTSASGTLTFADASDGDSNPNFTVTGAAGNGTASIDSVTGDWTYTPNADFNGSDSFTVSVTDDDGHVETQLISISVTAVNDSGSFGGNTSDTIDEDTSASGTLTFTDSSDGASAPNFTVTGAASNGTASIDSGTGDWTYTPDADFNGSDSFTVSVTDDDGHIETQLISISVTPVNDAPTITSSALLAVDEDSPYSYTFVAGDVDSGDVLTLSAPIIPAWLSFDATTGVLSGTPDNADVGEHSVVLQVNDGTAIVDQVFTITVHEVNDAPSAVNDHLSVTEDHALTMTIITDLLNNDSDPEGNSLTLTGFTQPDHGVLNNNDDGTLSYTPESNFNGTDSFDYTISDGQGGSATGQAYIVVSPVGDTPSVDDASVLAGQQTAPIVISRHPADGAEVTHFKISGISGGTLYQTDGTTQVNNGDYITVAQGQAGLRFTASEDATSGSFSVEASEDGLSVSGQSGSATSTISVIPATVIVPETSLVESTETVAEDDTTAEPETVEEEKNDESDIAEARPKTSNSTEVKTPSEVTKTTANQPFAVVMKTSDTFSSDLTLAADTQTREVKQTLNLILDKLSLGAIQTNWANLNIQPLSLKDYDLVRSSFEALDDEFQSDTHFETAVISSAVATSIGLSAGYVVWMLKGGSLLASVLSSMPAWHLADPLSILSGMQRDNDDDEESLESILKDSEADENEDETEQDKEN